ncbi:type IV secretory system conjugative DNA transfer family protein [Pseudolactococcus yaeyamensis]
MNGNAQKVPYAVFGTAAAYFANRATAVYLASTATTSNDKLSQTLVDFPKALSENPFSINLEPKPVLASVGCLAVAALFYAMRDTHQYRFGREHGTARWGTRREMKSFADKDFSQNIILGQGVYMSINERGRVDTDRNNNCMVIGGSGSWKTTSFIMSNLAQKNTSFVLTDPKGMTVRRVGKMLEDDGYKVKVCDFDTLMNSDHFNPYAYIHNEITLKQVISLLIDATNGEHAKKSEPFWDKSEEMLIAALASFLYYRYRGNGKIKGDGVMPSLADIGRLIRHLERTDDSPSVLEIMFDEFAQKFGYNNYAVLQFQNFKNFKGQTRSSVVAIGTARFSMFDLQDVQDFIKDDTLEIDKWMDEKYAIFLKIPDMDYTFNFLTLMVFLLAFKTLEAKVDNEYFGDPPVPIQFLLDEFVNLGKIPNIKKALSVFRSRKMSIAVILQSLNQLKAEYKDDWKSFVGNCDSIVYLSGSTEDETQKFFSGAAGKETIYTKERNRGQITHRPMGRDLITYSEVRTLSRRKALVSIASTEMFKVNKYNYKKHPNAKEFSDNPRDGKWYFYKRYKNNLEKFQDNTRKLEKAGKMIDLKVMSFDELMETTA